MTDEDLHHRIDAARVRAQLTVQDLWLRYLALGGGSDAFEVDGFLHGLVPMDSFQQNILAQTVNEALSDSYDSYSIPLANRTALDSSAHEHLRTFIQQVLETPPTANTER